jgi:parallel beta-helix repeat protein
MKKEMLILGMVSLFLLNCISSVSSVEINILKNSGDYTIHSPISIDGNDEFTAKNGVTGGSGTENDPYIIEGWDIKPSFLRSGIKIKNVNAHFVIKNCYIHQGGKNEGIVFYDVHNGIIDNNIITGNSHGICLGGQYECCRYNVISNNSIYLNTHNGIVFAHTMDFHLYNTITNNYIINNGGTGIYSEMSYFHEITYNNISFNKYGIGLRTCIGGEYHTLHHNNFFNNTKNQVYEPWSGFENYFDDGYPSGGNYWSDYTGEDYFSGPNQSMNGSDGIGDTPYAIPIGNNQDNYPFMSPCQLNENILPTQPIIVGPSNAKPGLEHNYTFIASDPNNDDLYYNIDWDDGTFEEWFGPYPSGVEVTYGHTWSEKGKYVIKARVKDTNELFSPWGTLDITISKNKILTNTFFQKLLERFPLLEQFLNLLIKIIL